MWTYSTSPARGRPNCGSESSTRPVEPSDIGYIAIACDDVDATVSGSVEECGSEVIGKRESLTQKDVRLAEISDPEGYTVYLIEEEDRE